MLHVIIATIVLIVCTACLYRAHVFDTRNDKIGKIKWLVIGTIINGIFCTWMGFWFMSGFNLALILFMLDKWLFLVKYREETKEQQQFIEALQFQWEMGMFRLAKKMEEDLFRK